MIEPIDSLNPFIGVNDNAYIFYGLVYDYLIAVDEDLHPKPNLATSWHIVPDQMPLGSVWQYNLTRNAKWHDGEPLDADDVLFTFDYQTGLNWATMWAYQPYTMLVDFVEKLDDYTVRIHFKDFEGNPTACSFGDALMVPIVPEHLWGDISPSDAAFSYPNYHPIGSGPFMCTENTDDEFRAGDFLILYKNPEYHGAIDYDQEVKFDRLIMQFYLEPTAMLADIQRGTLDVAAMSAAGYDNLVHWLMDNPTEDILTYAGLTCTGYSVEIGICMNEASGAMTNNLRLDPAVRQAMAHATDKEFIRDHIYRGYATVGSALLSPVHEYWYWSPPPDEQYRFDIDRANEILDEAGYIWNQAHTVRLAGPDNPYGMQGTPLSFAVIVEAELPEDKDTASFLREEWKQIGIDIELRIVSSAEWGTIVYNGAFDLVMTYWSGDPDPNYLLYVQSSHALGGWSENWYSSPEYDENYTLQILETDPEARRQYVHNCQKHTYRDAAFIVNVYPYGCYAWRNDTFTGWGDWEAHPGRSISNFWTANDLYFDLVPTSDGQEDTDGRLTLLIIGAGSVAALAAVLIALPRMRKRRPKEEEIQLP
jgi:peptide/nickel transport system substrate-binding protein